MIDSTFWLNKKVLVTGCTGFKGSWLTLFLDLLGAKLYGYSLPAPTNPSMWQDLQLENLYQKICYADIRDYKRLHQFIVAASPDILIHMAAQPLVKYSYANPRETYEVNVIGSVNVLDAVRELKTVKAVVNVTTDKCYENKEWLWGYRENEPLGGHDPYSSSKACSELVTAAFINSYFNSPTSSTFVASARAGNVIGGGDWASDRLIPDIIRSFQRQQEVLIRYPDAIRPWQHVLEPLSGYLHLAQKLYLSGIKYSGAWNFAPLEQDNKTVAQIVEQMCVNWGPSACWKIDSLTHPHEASLLRLDCTKAITQLGWKPGWNSDKTLRQLTLWYQAYFAAADMLSFTKAQIIEYLRDLKC